MITTVLFDMDGMVNEFPKCRIGKADLKRELAKYISVWGWEKSVDELVAYWFQSQNTRDERMIQSIHALRARGIRCGECSICPSLWVSFTALFRL